MFKKILALILTLAMLTSACFIFSSCDLINSFIPGGEGTGEGEGEGEGEGNGEGEVCEHTYDEAWLFDENEHWHAATCEHTDVKVMLAKHVDNDYDDYCDKCGYDMVPDVEKEPEAKIVTYRVDVQDANGNAIANVKIILISPNGFYTSTKTTNTKGIASFKLEEGEWTVALAEAVDGYSTTTDERFEFDGRTATVVLK